MKPRQRLLAAAAVLVVILAGAAVWFVHARSAAPPLNFAAAGADMAGARLHPGQADSFAVFLTARPAGVRFTVSHVSLIPLPGWRTPQILGALILRQRNVPLEASEYPPVTSSGSPVPVRSPTGHALVSGAAPHKIQDVLMIGLRSSRLGPCATAGVRITYQVNGHSWAAEIYNAAFEYYYPSQETPAQRKASLARYTTQNDKATARFRQLPGVKAVLSQQ